MDIAGSGLVGTQQNPSSLPQPILVLLLALGRPTHTSQLRYWECRSGKEQLVPPCPVAPRANGSLDPSIQHYRILGWVEQRRRA